MKTSLHFPLCIFLKLSVLLLMVLGSLAVAAPRLFVIVDANTGVPMMGRLSESGNPALVVRVLTGINLETRIMSMQKSQIDFVFKDPTARSLFMPPDPKPTMTKDGVRIVVGEEELKKGAFSGIKPQAKFVAPGKYAYFGKALPRMLGSVSEGARNVGFVSGYAMLIDRIVTLDAKLQMEVGDLNQKALDDCFRRWSTSARTVDANGKPVDVNLGVYEVVLKDDLAKRLQDQNIGTSITLHYGDEKTVTVKYMFLNEHRRYQTDTPDDTYWLVTNQKAMLQYGAEILGRYRTNLDGVTQAELIEAYIEEGKLIYLLESNFQPPYYYEVIETDGVIKSWLRLAKVSGWACPNIQPTVLPPVVSQNEAPVAPAPLEEGEEQEETESFENSGVETRPEAGEGGSQVEAPALPYCDTVYFPEPAVGEIVLSSGGAEATMLSDFFPGTSNATYTATMESLFTNGNGACDGPSNAIMGSAGPLSNYGIKLTGRIASDEACVARLVVTGDDGFQLFVNGEANPIIEHDGLHSTDRRDAEITLDGARDFELTYFQGPCGAAEIQLGAIGPLGTVDPIGTKSFLYARQWSTPAAPGSGSAGDEILGEESLEEISEGSEGNAGTPGQRENSSGSADATVEGPSIIEEVAQVVQAAGEILGNAIETAMEWVTSVVEEVLASIENVIEMVTDVASGLFGGENSMP